MPIFCIIAMCTLLNVIYPVNTATDRVDSGLFGPLRLQSSDALLLLSNPISAAPVGRLPPSVDLREFGLMTRVRDQGRCGACWAFTVTAVFEACILYDDTVALSSPFRQPTDILHLSEQFEVLGSLSNAFCSHGNVVRLINDHLMGKIVSVELASNFPYTLANDTSAAPPAVPPRPVLGSTDYLLPIYSEPKAGYRAGVIVIYNKNKPYGKDTRHMVETYLSLGVPVMATVNTWAGGSRGHKKIKQYRKGVLDAACENATMDHQVLIVGYGNYQNVPVWVVRNSWGERWGVHGYGYVRRGTNSYCLEHSAVAVLPQTLDQAAEYAPFSQALHHSTLTRSIYKSLIKRCRNGLDTDPPAVCSSSATRPSVQRTAQLAATTLLLLLLPLPLEHTPKPVADIYSNHNRQTAQSTLVVMMASNIRVSGTRSLKQ